MALENWSELHERLGLLALGYRRVLLCELQCSSCGAWRGAIESEADTYPCPGCGAACKLIVCCDRAFTKRNSIPWVKVGGPVCNYVKFEWNEDLFPRLRGKYIADRHRRKARRVCMQIRPPSDSKARLREDSTLQS